MSNLCIAVKTAEDKLEPTAQANSVATAIKLALLTKQAEQGLGFNTKEVIEESGEWEAPVTGTYKVTLISGGNSGQVINKSSYGGASGKHLIEFVELTKGQKVPVAIGAGGIPSFANTNWNVGAGGTTSFGELSTASSNNRLQAHIGLLQSSTEHITGASGSGFGGGHEYPESLKDATWYGGGGGAHWDNEGGVWAGNGYQGCVIAEWHDPEKVSLPTINDTDLIPYINLLQRLEAIEAQLNINS